MSHLERQGDLNKLHKQKRSEVPWQLGATFVLVYPTTKRQVGGLAGTAFCAGGGGGRTGTL